MHYLKIKKLLQKILPNFVFFFLIWLWRKTFVKFKFVLERIRLKKFKQPFFKKITFKNISYYLKIDPVNWHVDNYIYLHWIYEKDIFNIMYNNITEWDTFVDIWANIWIYTNFVPKLVWSRWKVIWFEPIKRVYEQNLDSIHYNGYTNVKLYNFACSDKYTTMYIYVNKDNVWASSLKVHNDLKIKIVKKEIIQTVIGDDILLKEDKVDFIKMDIEWYELYALKWIEWTIKKLVLLTNNR